MYLAQSLLIKSGEELSLSPHELISLRMILHPPVDIMRTLFLRMFDDNDDILHAKSSVHMITVIFN